jgi:hypothetical protein
MCRGSLSDRALDSEPLRLPLSLRLQGRVLRLIRTEFPHRVAVVAARPVKLAMTPPSPWS